MAGTQRLLAMAMVSLLVGVAVYSTPDVLGIILGSNRASLGAHSASEGTSVYDGDRLSTEAGGRCGVGPRCFIWRERVVW
jgi:hypothetical protein